MEEAARRLSQTFQVISGNLAELCVEQAIVDHKLECGRDYDKKRERTDFILYYPNKTDARKKHRVEVKNMKLRERATRGLAFDGDSLIGFFDDPTEFTISNISIIDEHCTKTGGFCYIPPQTLAAIQYSTRRFRPNTLFGRDAAHFCKTGSLE